MHSIDANDLVRWIKERERVRTLKEAKQPRPWSSDPVFQSVYFCNVNRENDKTTKFIRQMYTPEVSNPLFDYNIVFARFINNINTLEKIGYIRDHRPDLLADKLEWAAKHGPIWGGAYIITTHGQRMGKVAYLTQQVLPDALRLFESRVWRAALGGCRGAATALQTVPGIGSFLAGQVVADMKNTPGHRLYDADDKFSFVVPGPGSARGMSWVFHGSAQYASTYTQLDPFVEGIETIGEYVRPNIEPILVDNQDLQNCLCEFDKYCRVRTGTGRSKRTYPGG